MMSHQQCLTLSGFIRQHLETHEPLTSEKHFSRNQVIYFIGNPADEIYLLNSGRVKITRVSPTGREIIINIYQTGDFFGELCLCKNSLRTDQAVALSDVRVVSFKAAQLLQVISKEPQGALELLTLLCQRLYEAQGQIETLAFDNTPRRLAKQLLKMCGEGGEKMSNGVRVSQYLTHEELSQLIGTSREIVTAIMNRFQRQGLVAYTRKSLIVNPTKTERYLQG